MLSRLVIAFLPRSKHLLISWLQSWSAVILEPPKIKRYLSLNALHWSLQGASPVAQMVKNLPAMQENWVRSLGWQDSLEEGVATHSSILAWIIPWTEKAGGVQSTGLQRVGNDWVTNTKHNFTRSESSRTLFFQGHEGCWSLCGDS